MTQIERTFTFQTKQTSRTRTCCMCGKKTKKGDIIHHVSEVGTMTTLCDECFKKLKDQEEN